MTDDIIMADRTATTYDPASLLLEPLPLDPGTILAGTPSTAWRVLETSPDGRVTRGVWEITPGAVRDVEADELFVVLFGRATLEVAGGPTLELGPGTLGLLREGDATVWHVHETLRKVFQDSRRVGAPSSADAS